MAKQTVSRTALGAAICRLIEQYQPDNTRLFNDPVVGTFVNASVKFLMKFDVMRDLTIRQTDALASGIYGAQICRTRYIDDAVQVALGKGIRQVVILGAGYDTPRPYRLSGMDLVKGFEVDLPSMQKDKKAKVQKYLGRLPEHVVFIPIDFDTQSLEAVFAGTAFDLSTPSVFIWEGVTQYISEAAVKRILAFVGKTAPGSIIVFTYVLKNIIERHSPIPGATQMMDFVAQNAAWVFGLEPSHIPEFLQPFHLCLLEDVGNADYQEKYLLPIKRKLTVFEGERISQAVVV